MGVENNIKYDKFPVQTKYSGKKVEVCFNYDTSSMVKGVIVRDDKEKPLRTIIELVDGKFVLGTECQYRIL